MEENKTEGNPDYVRRGLRWYVLYVLTGKEYDVQEALRRKSMESVVPTESRIIRAQGKWMEREYVLFPNYVFIHVDLNADAYHRLRGVAGVVKLLKTAGAPSPLTDSEAAWITRLGESLVMPSTIEFLGGGMYRIVDGALKELVNQIEHIDRHRRRARVKLTVAGSPRCIELSYKAYQRLKI